MDTAVITTADQVQKILLFKIGETDFALKLSDVTEIIKIGKIRKIPRVPGFIEGILHLRGENIIIVSLRKLLLIKGSVQDKAKVIILSWEDRKIGFIVDDVSRIVQKKDKEILPPPPVHLSGPAPDCIKGVFEEKDSNILMIDLKKSLSSLEEEGLNQVLEKELSFLIDQINE